MRQVIRVIKTPVTLIILLALVAVGGWWGLNNATAAIPPRPPEPCVKIDVGGKLTPKYVTVRTLNAGLRGGLAKRVSTEPAIGRLLHPQGQQQPTACAETVVIGSSKDNPEVKLVAKKKEEEGLLQERHRPRATAASTTWSTCCSATTTPARWPNRRPRSR